MNLPSTRLPSSCRWKVPLVAAATWRAFIVARQEWKDAAYVSPASFFSPMDSFMRCAICHNPLNISDARVLPTTDGHYVHLACAEREAYAAARRRRTLAIISAVAL